MCQIIIIPVKNTTHYSMELSKKTYLLLVAHRSLSTDHDLAARLLFQLFGRHPAWPQYSAHEIKLKR